MEEDEAREALKTVEDPEAGMNIVDLGLVYAIRCEPGRVRVRMTMTSAACPVTDAIVGDVEAELDRVVPPPLRIEVELVWEPPWTPERMSPQAQSRFGWS